MTSEVRLDTAYGLYSGGRRPAFKPQQMASADTPANTPARKEAPVMLVKVDVRAPCEDCLHAVVCGRRDSITALNQGDLAVNHSPLRGGLTLVLSARVDCDAYLPAEETRSKAPAAVPIAELPVAQAVEAPSEAGTPTRAKRRLSPEGLVALQLSAERSRAKRAEKRAAANQESAG